MNVDDLLELIDETLDDSFSVPLSGKRMVDADRLKDILDDVRRNLPEEIKQAKRIVEDRTVIVDGARREADSILKKAEDRARVMVNEQEIVKQSQQRATEILAAAQQQSREMSSKVSKYCEDMLRQTEETLDRGLQDVRKLRGAMRGKAKR